MTEDKELIAINAMLEALKPIDCLEDKQRAVEYVLRRIASGYYAGAISSNQFDQMAKQQVAAGLCGPGQNKVFRGLA
jgi:hypothetical protein